MILRRLATSFRQQDWFAVVLEISIVVVGLFLGLQVDGWNEYRKDRALEQEYLQRLYEDLDGSLSDHVANSAWDQTRLVTQEVVLDALRSGTLPDYQRRDFDRGIVMAGAHNPIRRRWGTIEELKATGNIALLRDLSLRASIAGVEANHDRLARILSTREQQLVELLGVLSRYYGPVEYDFYYSNSATVEYDFDELVASEEFLRVFANLHLHSQIIVRFIEAHMAEIEGLRDQVADQIGVAPEERFDYDTRREFSRDRFFDLIYGLCGRAFEGRVTESVPADPELESARLVMHVRECTPGRVRVPFHVGDDRSRTWVVHRQVSGGESYLEFRHEHRHEDGSFDEVTGYGGFAPDEGTSTRQSFPADALTADMVPEAATNVWTLEIVPGERFVYSLVREGSDRRFRAEFDLSRPVELPPDPW